MYFNVIAKIQMVVFVLFHFEMKMSQVIVIVLKKIELKKKKIVKVSILTNSNFT